MLWLAPGLVLVGLLLSLSMTAGLIAIGTRWNMLDSPGSAGHFKALRPVPNIGGVAIAGAFLLPWLGAMGAVSGLLPIPPESLWGGIEGFSQRLHSGEKFGWILIACVVWTVVAGLIDDRRAMQPCLKLLLQIVPAVAIAWIADVRPLTMLDSAVPMGYGVSVFLGVVWLLVLINAMNYMDNMDGLSAGVGAIAALLLMGVALVSKQWFIAGLFGLLTGSLVGFLVFNFFPRGGARIFMGDAGSQTLGLLLGALAIRCTYTDPADAHYAMGSHWYGVATPVIVLAIPLYDLVATSVVRVKQGMSPFVGDQQHFSHRLVQRGFTKRGAVYVIWAMAAVIGIGGVSLGSLAPWQALLVCCQTLLALGVLAAVEGIHKR